MIRDVSACVYLLGGGLAQVILAAALITFRPQKPIWLLPNESL